MKRSLLTILTIVFVGVIAAGAALFTLTNNSTFHIEEKYYRDGAIEEISVPELENLVSNKESFLLFVSQQDCRTSADFRAILQTYIESVPLHVLEISFSDLKTSDIADEVRFYPSFLIFKKGQLIEYLEADNNDDVPAYTTQNGFDSWIRQTIIIE